MTANWKSVNILQMKNNKTKQSKQTNIVQAMQSSRGRFFGLSTTQGESINARFISETPATVVVYDRNYDEHRRLKKTSLSKLRMGAVQIS